MLSPQAGGDGTVIKLGEVVMILDLPSNHYNQRAFLKRMYSAMHNTEMMLTTMK
jgi:hypothetical protein